MPNHRCCVVALVYGGDNASCRPPPSLAHPPAKYARSFLVRKGGRGGDAQRRPSTRGHSCFPPQDTHKCVPARRAREERYGRWTQTPSGGARKVTVEEKKERKHWSSLLAFASLPSNRLLSLVTPCPALLPTVCLSQPRTTMPRCTTIKGARQLGSWDMPTWFWGTENRHPRQRTDGNPSTTTSEDQRLL